MKIRKIEAMRVALACDTGKKNSSMNNPWGKMETLLVRVTTDDDVEGWGEAFGHLLNPVTMQALAKLVAPGFIGKDVESLPTILDTAQHELHGFGRTGPVMYALSAIDIALWDITAKIRNTPLRHLLGASRDSVQRYASLVSNGNDPQQVTEQVLRTYAMGYRKIKLHETEVPAFLAARTALPDDAELMLDVNCPWSLQQANQVTEQLKGKHFSWLEEPIWPPEDVSSLAQVRAHGNVPIAAGENVVGAEGFRQLFDAQAIDIAQPSVIKIGGISAMRSVIALAQQYQVKVIPHCFYYGPGLLATAQIVSSLPEDIPLEVPFVHFEQCLHPYLDFSQPQMSLPKNPGLGFEPDQNILSQHVIESFTVNA